MITGRDDWTLLAHRGSYKTTCLSLAMAALMCLSPGRSILFLRKTDKDVEEVVRQVRQILLSAPMQALTARLYGGAPVGLTRATASELCCDCRFTPSGAVQLRGQIDRRQPREGESVKLAAHIVPLKVKRLGVGIELYQRSHRREGIAQPEHSVVRKRHGEGDHGEHREEDRQG